MTDGFLLHSYIVIPHCSYNYIKINPCCFSPYSAPRTGQPRKRTGVSMGRSKLNSWKQTSARIRTLQYESSNFSDLLGYVVFIKLTYVYTSICVDIHVYYAANDHCLYSSTTHHCCPVCFSDSILSQIGHTTSSQNKVT